MTYAECLARLAACEPMKRGERLATQKIEFNIALRFRLWFRMCGAAQITVFWREGVPLNPEDVRRHAFPLRRAREERQVWRAATFAAGELRTSEAVGAALLGFFSDLAILVRNTPAPCPWCGSKTFLVAYGRYVMCRQCEATGPHMFAADPVHAFNRVAVAAAFARLKDGE